MNKLRNAGGTPGGIGEFVIGLIMAIAGLPDFQSSVVVSGFWSMWGYSAFGLSMIPLIFGIGILFFKANPLSAGSFDHRGGGDHRGDPGESPHLFSANQSLQYHYHDCAISRRDRVNIARACASR